MAHASRARAFLSVDGEWSTWSEWSECSVTCSCGSHSRRRSCVGQAHGGEFCSGNNNETQECCNEACPSMCSPLQRVVLISHIFHELREVEYFSYFVTIIRLQTVP